MVPGTDHGERLMAPLIDAYAANDPARVWASIPKNVLPRPVYGVTPDEPMT